MTDTVSLSSSHTTDRRTRWGSIERVPSLVLIQAFALVGQAVAVTIARQAEGPVAIDLSFFSLAVSFASSMWVLIQKDLERRMAYTAAVCLGVGTALFWRITDPILFTGYDEQLHVRTLVDILTSHGLFHDHPLLGVSPHYPGLEAGTSFLVQMGLPSILAGTVVIIVSRIVLTLALCSIVEHATGSARIGGLAVGVYATSPQFVFFNSQFAYQTLALPLALAAIALTGKARTAESPRALIVCASLCVVAVTVTHHVTSFLMAAFLLVWAATSGRGVPARRTWLVAGVAAMSTGLWALVQWSLLRDYFGPIINDLAVQIHFGGARRAAFKDPSGAATPSWERAELVYYAIVVCSSAVLAVVLNVRNGLVRPVQARLLGFMPSEECTIPTLILALTILTPLVFVGRLLPSGGELGDRATSFIFLPYSFAIAYTAMRWARGREIANRTRGWALLAATLAFVGGHVLGGGPDWQRLPGQYMPAAEGRSMDSETLAAVAWAQGHIQPGSRIVADRISGDLLSSNARLWPVLLERGIAAPSLYFGPRWGPEQTAAARALEVRYLYVDDRLSSGLPRVGAYFYRGETNEIAQLTYAQLSKFDRVPGISMVYRHGPVKIYDLAGLGIRSGLTGWTGTVDPPDTVTQTLQGLVGGVFLLLLCLVASRRAQRIHAIRRAAGGPLVLATAVAVFTILSVAQVLSHFWIGVLTVPIAVVVLVIGLGLRFGGGWTMRSNVDLAAPRVGGRDALRTIMMWSIIVALTSAAFIAAVLSAYEADVKDVTSILRSVGSS